MTVRSQVEDYVKRGDGLEDTNVLQFFVDTREIEVKENSRDEGEEYPNVTTRRGRPRHDRVRYQESHSSYNTRQRLFRAPNHNTLPNFIGIGFARSDDPEIQEYYSATMLMLFKPWRHLDQLKEGFDTWTEAFDRFLQTASHRTHSLISNIQHFHRCSAAAQMEREKEEEELAAEAEGPRFDTNAAIRDDATDAGDHYDADVYTQETLDNLRAQLRRQENPDGYLAVEKGHQIGMFQTSASSTLVGSATVASDQDVQNLNRWQDILRNAGVSLTQDQTGETRAEPREPQGDVRPLDTSVLQDDSTSSVFVRPSLLSEEALPGLDPGHLLTDQRRAYDIVTWHLSQHLAGAEIPQLMLQIQGEGGTGKSKVIQTITEFFVSKGASDLLVKSAYTGIAASLISGKTTHTIAAMSASSNPRMGSQTKARLEAFWRGKRYLIIDEVSMISKKFFAALSRNITMGKPLGVETGSPFGGLNVIICGDFHQFPPVAQKKTSPLYYRVDLSTNSAEELAGRRLYEQFSHVVLLKEQVRVTDETWLRFLRNLRFGRTTQSDIEMLKTIVIGHDQCPTTNYSEEPWSEAFLVTPRHVVRNRWNEAQVSALCQRTQQPVLTCPAEDRVGNREMTIEENCAYLAQRQKRKMKEIDDKRLSDELQIAIGMKVMLTVNVDTDIDVANGARGVITGIWLHPDDTIDAGASSVRLRHLPLCILVKLERTRAAQLPGLPEGVLPLVPSSAPFYISLKTRDRGIVKRRVLRRQYPITPAYAFTDYRALGQTIPYVIVDIKTPRTGAGLSLFNLYVALSRSKGRESIRLLREFDDQIFMKSHDEELAKEDQRLSKLDDQTKRWWDLMSEGRS